MIKIWKGIEKEGVDSEAEVMTLFICSTTTVPFFTVLNAIVDNTDVKALYFGAGRREFCGMNARDWDRLIIYCENLNIKITIEVSPMMLGSFIHLYNHPLVTFVVAYYNMPKNVNKLFFKTDDFEVTKIYTPKVEVDITDVADDRYPDDVVVYEEAEE